MAQNVDPNKVIQKLVVRMANDILESVITEVALEDSNAVIANHEASAVPDAG